jgi:uncharacterized protein YjiS (DUF1127 family)
MTTLSIKFNPCCIEKNVSKQSIVNLFLTKKSLYWQKYHTRRSLKKLRPEQLKDIGITQEAARLEYKKPFWK